MEDVPPRKSFLQHYYLDIFHDGGLMIRALFNNGISNTTWRYLVLEYDINNYLMFGLMFNLICLTVFLIPKTERYVGSILFTVLVVECVGQYAAYVNFCLKIDMLTVYLFVWQLTSLGYDWMHSHVLPPILIFERVSYCLITPLVTWMFHSMCVRYIPLTISLLMIWILSLMDIFQCLHYRGSFYQSYMINKRFSKRKYPEPSYYVEGIDKWQNSSSLAFGDFCIYNMLILLVIPPSSSIITKLCVTFGSIISVQLGCFITDYFHSMVTNITVPGIPLPVIAVSIYIFILNCIIPEKFNQCIEV